MVQKLVRNCLISLLLFILANAHKIETNCPTVNDLAPEYVVLENDFETLLHKGHDITELESIDIFKKLFDQKCRRRPIENPRGGLIEFGIRKSCKKAQIEATVDQNIGKLRAAVNSQMDGNSAGGKEMCCHQNANLIQMQLKKMEFEYDFKIVPWIMGIMANNVNDSHLPTESEFVEKLAEFWAELKVHLLERRNGHHIQIRKKRNLGLIGLGGLVILIMYSIGCTGKMLLTGVALEALTYTVIGVVLIVVAAIATI